MRIQLRGSVERDLISRLVRQLEQPLPGRPAQRKFSPALSYGRHFGPPPADTRTAAVLALVFTRDQEWRMALTRRPENLADHAGQICLPGGVLETGETPEAAAVRECHEELGLEAGVIRILGRLTPLHVFGTGYWVTPYVGTCPPDPKWRPSTTEVDEVIEVPLAVIAQCQNVKHEKLQRGPVVFEAPTLCWLGYRIWGATAMILGELTVLLRGMGAVDSEPERA